MHAQRTPSPTLTPGSFAGNHPRTSSAQSSRAKPALRSIPPIAPQIACLLPAQSGHGGSDASIAESATACTTLPPRTAAASHATVGDITAAALGGSTAGSVASATGPPSKRSTYRGGVPAKRPQKHKRAASRALGHAVTPKSAATLSRTRPESLGACSLSSATYTRTLRAQFAPSLGEPCTIAAHLSSRKRARSASKSSPSSRSSTATALIASTAAALRTAPARSRYGPNAGKSRLSVASLSSLHSAVISSQSASHVSTVRS